MADLPENVSSAMFLRDGWPDAIVCKVLMKNGCIGIGIKRQPPLGHLPRLTPAQMDAEALKDAIDRVSATPPDYTDLQEHVAKQLRDAEARAAAARDADDLQASLGHPAHATVQPTMLPEQTPPYIKIK